MSYQSKKQIIKQTKAWFTSFIIKYNICPFAKQVYEKDNIYYTVVESETIEYCLHVVFSECLRLDARPDIATSFIIYANHFNQYNDYLEFIYMAQLLLTEQNYDGIYQLASFHPHYSFYKSSSFDPANYTNRSPYPMIHLIRESSLDHVLQSLSNPEKIPEKNIRKTRKMGLKKVQAILNKAKEIN